MSFKDLIGQDRAVALLQADLEAGRVADTYLFSGPQGAGKMAAALELAKALNCRRLGGGAGESEGGLLGLVQETQPSAGADPCDQCTSCRKVGERLHPDVFILDFETQAQLLDLKEDEKARQKELRIDSVRSLISQAYKTPLEGRNKVFIIDGAELLSPESSNALLKVLEESPKQARWVLLSVSPDRILPTIQSRCRKISFAPLGLKELEQVRKRQAAASLEKPQRGRAKKEEDGEELEALADALAAPQAPGAVRPLEWSARVVAEARKGNGRRQAEQFLRVLTLKLSERLRRDPRPEDALRIAQVLQAQEDLRRNVSPQMVLDSLFFALARP